MIVRKIISLFTQLLLTPISLLQSGLFWLPLIYLFTGEIFELGADAINSFVMIPLLFVLCWGIALIVNKIFYKIKGQKLHKYSHYDSFEGYYITETKKRHETYYDGQLVDSFDYSEYDMKHDDGWRREETKMMKIAKFTMPFAIIMRLVAIIFAVIALFVPRMISSVSVPRIAKKRGYSVVLHCMFDIIILK